MNYFINMKYYKLMALIVISAITSFSQSSEMRSRFVALETLKQKEIKQNSFCKPITAQRIGLQKIGQFSKVDPKHGEQCGLGGATVGAFLGAGIVQGTYWGITGAIGVAVTAVSGPVTASAVVGVWNAYTAPVVADLTIKASLAGSVALGAATGPV